MDSTVTRGSAMVRWFDSLAHARPRVILTHGEDKPRGALRRIIADRHQLKAECPALGEVIQF